MSSSTIYNLILILAVLFLSLLLMLVPLKILNQITAPFSFKTFGIRKIRRWHSRTDTLANLFLWISVLFSILFPLIPESRIVYGIWLTFTWLCTLSRAVRLTQVRKSEVKMTVILMLSLLFGYGLVSGLGLFDHGGLWKRSAWLFGDLAKPENQHLFYFLRSPNFTSYLLQAAIMIVSLCSLWGQFKYMRLENTYKARFLTTYVLKNLIVSLVILAAGVYGLPFMEGIYRVSDEERLTGKGTEAAIDFDHRDEKSEDSKNPDENQDDHQNSSQNEDQTEPPVSAETENSPDQNQETDNSEQSEEPDLGESDGPEEASEYSEDPEGE